MTHWGWYWKVKKKHKAKKLCSELNKIDSFKLYKRGSHAGFIVEPLKVKADPVKNGFLITYRKQLKPSYKITTEKLPCNYGGFRQYFKCPLCSRRMRYLYFAENSIFLCRKCLNLSYTTQQLRTSMRYSYISQKIKDYIHGKDGDLYFKKPKGMHIRTYQRLKSKQFYYEHKSYQATNNELRKWHGPQIEPQLDHFFDYVDENKDWKK